MAQVSNGTFVLAFWPMVAALVPIAVHHPRQCEDTFTLAQTIFKILAESSVDLLKLDDLLKQWGALLLSHGCTEVRIQAFDCFTKLIRYRTSVIRKL